MITMDGIDYLTADEALQRRLINKAEYERWIYGGLTKKQHDHSMALAMEANMIFNAEQAANIRQIAILREHLGLKDVPYWKVKRAQRKGNHAEPLRHWKTR